MASAIGDLVIRVNSQTGGAERGLTRLGQRMFTLRTAATDLVRAFAPLSAGYMFASVMRSGERFNQSMREALAITEGVTASLEQRMRRTAATVARDYQYAMADVGKTYFYIESAGLAAEQAVEILPQAARFARAGMADLQTATEAAAQSVAALGMKGNNTAQYLENFTRVTDVLVKANTLAQATTMEFADALRNDAANAGRIAHQSLEEIVAVLAALAERGIKGEKAGRDYARALTYLSIQAVENREAFKAAGVAMFDASDNTRRFVDVIADLERRFAGMSDAERTAELQTLGFTKRTISLMNSLLGTSEAIRGFTKDLGAAGDVAENVAEKQIGPLQRGASELGSAATSAGADFMDAFGSPAVGGVLSAAATAIGQVRTALAGVGIVAGETRDELVQLVGGGRSYGGRWMYKLAREYARATGDEDAIALFDKRIQAINDAVARADFDLPELAQLPERLRDFPRMPAMEEPERVPTAAEQAAKRLAEAWETANEVMDETFRTQSDLQTKMEEFLTPLREGGASAEQLAQAAMDFGAAWADAAARDMTMPESAGADARRRARDLAQQWQREAEQEGMDWRDRMIANISGTLGESPEAPAIMEMLRQWDHELDKIEEKTKATDFAKRLRMETETPVQRAMRDLDELEAKAKKLGTPQELVEAKAQQIRDQLAIELDRGDGKDFGHEAGLEFAGAAQRGTAEAYSAILRGMSAKQGPEKQMVDGIRGVERNTDQTNEELREANRKLDALGVEPIGIPGG